MSEDQDASRKDRSDDDGTTYIVPFGRYEASRSTEYPANEVLVGRERQRATFLNHLFSAGRRGAYLITGHRGSGKTSFARHCLQEYQNDVYRRYLQRNVGRAFLWDRIGQIVVGAVLVLAGLVLSGVLTFLLKYPEPKALALAIILGVTTVLGYPFVAAYRTFADIISNPDLEEHKSENERTGKGSGIRSAWRKTKILLLEKIPYRVRVILAAAPSFWSLVITVAATIGALFWTSAVEPDLGMAQVLLVVTCFFTLCHLISVSDTHKRGGPTDEPTIAVESPPPGCLHWRRLSPLVAFLLPLSFPWWPPASKRMVLVYVAAAALIWSIGLAGRWAHQGRFRSRLEKKYGKKPSQGQKSVLKAVKSAYNWHSAILPVFLTSALVFFLCASHVRATALGPIFLLLSVIVIAWIARSLFYIARGASQHQTENESDSEGSGEEPPFPRFHPRPSGLLFLRGLATIAFGTQLLYPVLRETLLFLRSHSSFLDNFLESSERVVESWAPGFDFQLGRLSYFNDPATELPWILCVLLLLILFHSIEFDWIIRPYSNMREDFALHRALEKNSKGVQRFSKVRERCLTVARQTIFWKVCSNWLPVLKVPVNLGFDSLDQRVVIEAMLVGLRDTYRRTFLHWSSTFTAVRRGLGILFLLVLSIWVGDHLFYRSELNEALENKEVCQLQRTETGSVDSRLETSFKSERPLELGVTVTSELGTITPPTLPPALWLTCDLLGEPGIQAMHWSPFVDEDLRKLSRPDASRLMVLLFNVGDEGRGHIFDVRLYHFGLFVLLLFAFTRLGRAWGIPLYRQIDRRMTDMLDRLSSRLREESRPPGSPFRRWIGNLWGKEVVHEKEGGPFDPRTVELGFLQILRDIQDPSIQIPFGSNRRVSPPIPEVIFVFDELDKVGIGTSTPPTDTSGPELVNVEPLDQERERSRSLHKLFADLKNTISSGQARFIFIGGRNLHDEWLADQTARRPLLTNIFDQEIYLPSLLTDGDDPCAFRLTGIKAFVQRQLYRSYNLQKSSLFKRARPWPTLWVEDLRRPAFVQVPFPRKGVDSRDQWPPLEVRFSQTRRTEEGENDQSPTARSANLFQDSFYKFLAYRSKGNVKMLRELLESFIETTGQINQTSADPFSKFEAGHVLMFRENERFRIQLVASVYRQLIPVLGERIQLGDDKMPQAILYLSDFLLKFHRRAFSWSNIERVDELVHIHRAPDLRQALRQIVWNWTDRFLHKIRNGMYDYRSTSELAQELEYISRCSEQELAAFNFTLDESQFLKAIYRSRIEVFGDEMGGDFVAGLADLHKFDEEYELARTYYRKAIANLDRRFNREIRSRAGRNPVHDVLMGSDVGTTEARAVLSWGITRLRLMLQVGVSFERSKDFEHALVEYREARTLSRSLIRGLLGWLDSARAQGVQDVWRAGVAVPETKFEDFIAIDSSTPVEYLATLKHLNILFQPTFAEAWLAEKMVFGVDTGPAIVETELWRLRESMPFVNSGQFAGIPRPDGAIGIRHSNLAVAMGELHNKAGDLLFFKGRQLVSMKRIMELASPISQSWDEDLLDELRDRHHDLPEPSGRFEGYLMRAVYHYNLALHDTRRYNSYRKLFSGVKHGPTNDACLQTIEREGWPDYLLLTAAGSLADLADAYLGVFSFTGLAVSLLKEDHDRNNEGRGLACKDEDLSVIPHGELAEHGVGAAFERVVSWLEHPSAGAETATDSSTPQWSSSMQALAPTVKLTNCGLKDWLAAPLVGKAASYGQLLAPTDYNKDYERVVAGLLLSLVAGRMLDRGGYTEAAGRQFLSVAEATASLLWWRVGLKTCFEKTTSALHELATSESELKGYREKAEHELCPEIIALQNRIVSQKKDLKAQRGLVRPDRLLRFLDRLSKMRILHPQTFARIYPFYLNLATIGVVALEFAERSFVRSRPVTTAQRNESTYRIGVQIPSSALTLACSLGLVLELEEDPEQCKQLAQRVKDARSSLRSLIERWSDSSTGDGSVSADWYRDHLRTSLSRNLYPMLNQLNGLKVLVDHAVLCDGDKYEDEAVRDIDRLWRKKQQYDSPLHFTPQKVGFSLALTSLLKPAWKSMSDPLGWDRASIGARALQELYLSEQMFTMRQGYYEAISNLHYLYDDFNDSTIHFNHAVQMAAAETTAFLIRTLEAHIQVASDRPVD